MYTNIFAYTFKIYIYLHIYSWFMVAYVHMYKLIKMYTYEDFA